MTAYVYIVGNPHLPSSVKIGITNNLKTRLSALSTGNSEKLSILHNWKLPTITDARNVERLAHGRLSQYRLSGEWFDVTPEVAKLAVDNIINKDSIMEKSKHERMLKAEQLKAELKEVDKLGKELSTDHRIKKQAAEEAYELVYQNLILSAKLAEEIKKYDY
jgi:hypothetical protein